MTDEIPQEDSRDAIERWLDKYFETPFFHMRHITLVPVLFAFCGAIVMFAIGSIETIEAIHVITPDHSMEEAKKNADHLTDDDRKRIALCTAEFAKGALLCSEDIKNSVVLLIKAVDAFLLGLVMMIFSYGIYDLFISKIDPAERAGARPNWIKFKDMGGLKITLAQVVLIILIITFFEIVVTNIDKFTDVWSFLIIPIGVLFIGIGIGVFVKITDGH